MNSSTHCPHTLDQQRQRFERLVNGSQPKAGNRVFVNRLIALGGSMMRFLTANQELRIWQRTRNGRPVWFAYDPMTDQKRQFFAEEDVRRWLDTRYYE
jgi:hypothetical protein